MERPFRFVNYLYSSWLRWLWHGRHSYGCSREVLLAPPHQEGPVRAEVAQEDPSVEAGQACVPPVHMIRKRQEPETDRELERAQQHHAAPLEPVDPVVCIRRLRAPQLLLPARLGENEQRLKHHPSIL